MITELTPPRCIGYIKTCSKLEQYVGPSEEWPEALQLIRQCESDVALKALGMAISYLEDSLIAERTLGPATYELHE